MTIKNNRLSTKSMMGFLSCFWSPSVFVLFLLLAAISLPTCQNSKDNATGAGHSTTDRTIKNKNDREEIASAKSLGFAYLEENRLDEAELQFLRLIELTPDNAVGYANVGVVYLRMGKYDEAEKYLTKATELDSIDPNIRLNLAKLYEMMNNQQASMKQLKRNEEVAPEHIKTLYSIAETFAGADDVASLLEWEKYMRRTVAAAPQNIVARLYFVEALVRNEKRDEALKNLEEAQQIFPTFPAESQEFFLQAIDSLRDSKSGDAITPILIFHNFIKLTPGYQESVRQLKGAQSGLVGSPVISLAGSKSIGMVDSKAILDLMKFTDASVGAGLEGLLPNDSEDTVFASIAIADMDGDGDYDIYYFGYTEGTSRSFQYLLQCDFGKYYNITEASGLKHPGKDLSAVFADYDNDGFLDLFVCNSSSDLIFRNIDEGRFENTSVKATIESSSIKSLLIDLDQEGDLDIVLVKNGKNVVYINDGNGSFTMPKTQTGLSESPLESKDAAFGDIDSDGDLDILVANANGPLQYFQISEVDGLRISLRKLL
jgi:tetratricopeptide (TPR) repeat protein